MEEIWFRVSDLGLFCKVNLHFRVEGIGFNPKPFNLNLKP